MGAFTVEEPDRLDKVLAARPDVGSRRRAREAVETGKVTVDGEICREAGLPVEAGQTVEVHWNRPGTGKAVQKAKQELRDAGLSIVYEDEHLVAVDKPAGLLTDTASQEQHRTRDSAYKRLRAWLRTKGDRPRTVHRIDVQRPAESNALVPTCCALARANATSMNAGSCGSGTVRYIIGSNVVTTRPQPSTGHSRRLLS